MLGGVNSYSQDSDTPTNKVIHADGYTYEFQSAAAPDLSEWMHKELAPVVKEWYPKIVKMLPGDGYEAPTNVTIRFRTVGDATCTGAVESTASTIDEVVAEVAAARQTERGTRADDKRSETAMEDRKKEGYF